MSELSILELEAETIELLPVREALKHKKRRGRVTVNTFQLALAAGGAGGAGGDGGDGGSQNTTINQEAYSIADGKYAYSSATNIAVVDNSGSDLSGGNGGAGGDGGDAEAHNHNNVGGGGKK